MTNIILFKKLSTNLAINFKKKLSLIKKITNIIRFKSEYISRILSIKNIFICTVLVILLAHKIRYPCLVHVVDDNAT